MLAIIVCNTNAKAGRDCCSFSRSIRAWRRADGSRRSPSTWTRVCRRSPRRRTWTRTTSTSAPSARSTVWPTRNWTSGGFPQYWSVGQFHFFSFLNLFSCPHTFKFQTSLLVVTASGMAGDCIQGRWKVLLMSVVFMFCKVRNLSICFNFT